MTQTLTIDIWSDVMCPWCLVGWGGLQQALGQLAALGARQVQGDGLLALVQPLPIEARSIGGERPAAEVGTPADIVEPDHLGAQLRQIEPAGRAGDEGRTLDYGEAFEQVVHGGVSCLRLACPGARP